MKVTGVNQSLAIVLCNGAQEAIDKGFNYDQWEKKPTPLNIENAVVVRGGMLSGKPTYDLVLVDEAGNKYVTMLTGNLMAMLARAGGSHA